MLKFNLLKLLYIFFGTLIAKYFSSEKIRNRNILSGVNHASLYRFPKMCWLWNMQVNLPYANILPERSKAGS